jgi:3',5'-cyclic-AMP phosphodiesterase
MNDFDNPVVIVVPGDLHLTVPGLENVRVAHWVVDEVNTLIRPDFVQFIGDNVQDATEDQFRLFDQIRGRLDVPQFALIGDHDIKDDPGAVGFCRRFGEPYGAMTLGGIRFIRLNTQESRPTGISAEQIGWLRNELDQADARGERIVIFQHNYPYQIWEDFAGPGIDDWRGLVQTHRVEGIICGHTHYWQMANDGRNALIAVRSIGDPEGGGPGYAVLCCRGDDLAVTYRSVEARGPVVLVTHPREQLLATGPRHIVSGPERVVVRVWSSSRVWAVRYSIDDGPWAGLELSDDGNWQGRLPTDRFTKGVHSLAVVASAADGTEGSQRIDFVVDPTGRYTAIPQVSPMVSATQFC